MSPIHNPAHTSELFKFIRILYDEQESMWSTENPDNDKFTYFIDALRQYNWLRIDHSDINTLEENWKKNQTIDFDTVRKYGNKVFFLRPLEKEDKFFVLMSLRCAMEPYSSEIRIMLITQKKPEDMEQRTNKNIFWGIGFRIETGTGMHQYHHAQLINNFKGHDNAPVFYDSIPWLPVTQPAFPLNATEPLTLMLSLYLTLYGLDRFKGIFKIYGPQLREIKKIPSVKNFLSLLDTTPTPISRR